MISRMAKPTFTNKQQLCLQQLRSLDVKVL